MIIDRSPLHSVQVVMYHAATIRAAWSPMMCTLERRINNTPLYEAAIPALQRAVTYDGPDALSSVAPVRGEALPREINHVCHGIAQHIAYATRLKCKIARMALHLKLGVDGKLCLLWATSIRLRAASATPSRDGGSEVPHSRFLTAPWANASVSGSLEEGLDAGRFSIYSTYTAAAHSGGQAAAHAGSASTAAEGGVPGDRGETAAPQNNASFSPLPGHGPHSNFATESCTQLPGPAPAGDAASGRLASDTGSFLGASPSKASFLVSHAGGLYGTGIKTRDIRMGARLAVSDAGNVNLLASVVAIDVRAPRARRMSDDHAAADVLQEGGAGGEQPSSAATPEATSGQKSTTAIDARVAGAVRAGRRRSIFRHDLQPPGDDMLTRTPAPGAAPVIQRPEDSWLTGLSTVPPYDAARQCCSCSAPTVAAIGKRPFPRFTVPYRAIIDHYTSLCSLLRLRAYDATLPQRKQLANGANDSESVHCSSQLACPPVHAANAWPDEASTWAFAADVGLYAAFNPYWRHACAVACGAISANDADHDADLHAYRSAPALVSEIPPPLRLLHPRLTVSAYRRHKTDASFLARGAPVCEKCYLTYTRIISAQMAGAEPMSALFAAMQPHAQRAAVQARHAQRAVAGADSVGDAGAPRMPGSSGDFAASTSEGASAQGGDQNRPNSTRSRPGSGPVVTSVISESTPARMVAVHASTARSPVGTAPAQLGLATAIANATREQGSRAARERANNRGRVSARVNDDQRHRPLQGAARWDFSGNSTDALQSSHGIAARATSVQPPRNAREPVAAHCNNDDSHEHPTLAMGPRRHDPPIGTTHNVTARSPFAQPLGVLTPDWSRKKGASASVTPGTGSARSSRNDSAGAPRSSFALRLTGPLSGKVSFATKPMAARGSPETFASTLQEALPSQVENQGVVDEEHKSIVSDGVGADSGAAASFSDGEAVEVEAITAGAVCSSPSGSAAAADMQSAASEQQTAASAITNVNSMVSPAATNKSATSKPRKALDTQSASAASNRPQATSDRRSTAPERSQLRRRTPGRPAGSSDATMPREQSIGANSVPRPAASTMKASKRTMGWASPSSSPSPSPSPSPSSPPSPSSSPARRSRSRPRSTPSHLAAPTRDAGSRSPKRKQDALPALSAATAGAPVLAPAVSPALKLSKAMPAGAGAAHGSVEHEQASRSPPSPPRVTTQTRAGPAATDAPGPQPKRNQAPHPLSPSPAHRPRTAPKPTPSEPAPRSPAAPSPDHDRRAETAPRMPTGSAPMPPSARTSFPRPHPTPSGVASSASSAVQPERYHRSSSSPPVPERKAANPAATPARHVLRARAQSTVQASKPTVATSVQAVHAGTPAAASPQPEPAQRTVNEGDAASTTPQGGPAAPAAAVSVSDGVQRGTTPAASRQKKQVDEGAAGGSPRAAAVEDLLFGRAGDSRGTPSSPVPSTRLGERSPTAAHDDVSLPSAAGDDHAQVGLPPRSTAAAAVPRGAVHPSDQQQALETTEPLPRQAEALPPAPPSGQQAEREPMSASPAFDFNVVRQPDARTGIAAACMVTISNTPCFACIRRAVPGEMPRVGGAGDNATSAGRPASMASGARPSVATTESLFILYVRATEKGAVTTVAVLRASELRASSNPLLQMAHRRWMESPEVSPLQRDVVTTLPSTMDGVIMHGMYYVGGRHVLCFVRMQARRAQLDDERAAAAGAADAGNITDAWATQPRFDVLTYDFASATPAVLHDQPFSELLQFAVGEKSVHFTVVYAAKCAIAAAAGYSPATSRGGTPWPLGMRPSSTPLPGTVMRLFPGHWLRGKGSLDRARGFAAEPLAASYHLVPSQLPPQVGSDSGAAFSVSSRAQSAPHIPRRLVKQSDLSSPLAVTETLDIVSLAAVAAEERAFVEAAEGFSMGEIARRSVQLANGEVVQCMMRVVLPAGGDVTAERANGGREALYHLRLASTRSGAVMDRYVAALDLRVPLTQPFQLLHESYAGGPALPGGNPFADVPAFLGCVDMPVQADEHLVACRIADGSFVQRFAGCTDTGSVAAAARHPLGLHPSVRLGGAYLLSLWVRQDRAGEVMMPAFRLRCQYLLQPLPVFAEAVVDAASNARRPAPPEVVAWIAAAAGWAGTKEAQAPSSLKDALRVQAMLSEPVYEYDMALADLARSDLNPFLER